MSQRYSKIDNGDMKYLRNNIHRIEPLLQHDEFVITEIQGMDANEQQAVKILQAVGAVKEVGTVKKDNGYGLEPHTKWQWDMDIQERVQEYYENMDTFPCGHKVTIFNPEWADELACKECEQEYSKEFVRELL